MRMLRIFLLVLVSLLPAIAQPTELSENNPVCIVTSVDGHGAEIKRPNGDWRPIYWMDLLRPQDQIRTAEGDKIVVNFFFDDHLEIVDPDSTAEVQFKNLVRVTDTSRVRRDTARDRSRATIDIPYMFLRKLKAQDFLLAQDPNAMEQENLFLQASVTNWTYPCVFQWGKVPGVAQYRVQFFNEWDEFLHEYPSKDTRWKFPYQGPLKLQKAGLYQWQVLTPVGAEQIVVRKYKFYVLTALQAREFSAAWNRFSELKRAKKVTRTNYTDLFLLVNRLNMVDERLRLLREMAQMDPENPRIQRGLVRAFLDKGCPAHANEALQREIQLGGSDDVEG